MWSLLFLLFFISSLSFGFLSGHGNQLNIWGAKKAVLDDNNIQTLNWTAQKQKSCEYLFPKYSLFHLKRVHLQSDFTIYKNAMSDRRNNKWKIPWTRVDENDICAYMVPSRSRIELVVPCLYLKHPVSSERIDNRIYGMFSVYFNFLVLMFDYLRFHGRTAYTPCILVYANMLPIITNIKLAIFKKMSLICYQ